MKSFAEWLRQVKLGKAKLEEVPEGMRKAVEKVAQKTPLWAVDPYASKQPVLRTQAQPIREAKQ